MKLKFLALSLVAVLAASGTALAINSPDDVGQIKRVIGARQDEPTRVYKLVRNPNRGANGVGEATGFASNDVVVYDVISDDGITVNYTTTSCDNTVAGIVAMTIPSGDNGTLPTSAADDIGRRNWGYIIVHGPAVAKVTTGGGTGGHSAGDPWFTSTDTGAAAGLQSMTNIGATNAVQKKLGARGGFFYDAAVTADSTAQVFVNLE